MHSTTGRTPHQTFINNKINFFSQESIPGTHNFPCGCVDSCRAGGASRMVEWVDALFQPSVLLAQHGLRLNESGGTGAASILKPDPHQRRGLLATTWHRRSRFVGPRSGAEWLTKPGAETLRIRKVGGRKGDGGSGRTRCFRKLGRVGRNYLLSFKQLCLMMTRTDISTGFYFILNWFQLWLGSDPETHALNLLHRLSRSNRCD